MTLDEELPVRHRRAQGDQSRLERYGVARECMQIVSRATKGLSTTSAMTTIARAAATPEARIRRLADAEAQLRRLA